jgi:hypothetical protein
VRLDPVALAREFKVGRRTVSRALTMLCKQGKGHHPGQPRGVRPCSLTSTCPICLDWKEGDAACPAHGGTYQEGVVCPTTGNQDHMVIACQLGAAYLCLTCEDVLDELMGLTHGAPSMSWRGALT